MDLRAITVLAAVALAGCVPAGRSPPALPVSETSSVKETGSDIAAFCKLIKPLTLARNDSAETQDEIRKFNAAFTERCGAGAFSRHGK